MKIISIEAARVTEMFVSDEVKPTGGLYMPDLIRLFSERFGFIHRPSLDRVQAGAEFKGGMLAIGKKKINILDLTVFNNAITINTPNSQDTEIVLEDTLAWAQKTFHFRVPQTPSPITFYESQMVVDFDHAIDKKLALFKNLKNAFESQFETVYHVPTPAHISGFFIGVDPQQLPATLVPFCAQVLKPNMTIERRLGFPYTQNRFFSLAPFSTDAHTQLLETFEKLLA